MFFRQLFISFANDDDSRIIQAGYTFFNKELLFGRLEVVQQIRKQDGIVVPKLKLQDVTMNEIYLFILAEAMSGHRDFFFIIVNSGKCSFFTGKMKHISQKSIAATDVQDLSTERHQLMKR